LSDTFSFSRATQHERKASSNVLDISVSGFPGCAPTSRRGGAIVACYDRGSKLPSLRGRRAILPLVGSKTRIRTERFRRAHAMV
jgi:hypothetical protein